MPLNSTEIRARKLIQDAELSGYRASTYDVSIGSILDPDAHETDSHVLRPQEMVIAISSERVTLPATVTGYAMPKTTMCIDGVLPLSTGIIDPGYQGLMSSILINFGSSPQTLKKGDPFLRLSFHEVNDPNHSRPPLQMSDKEYRRDRAKGAAKLPGTFLDIRHHVAEIADKVATRQLSKLVTGIVLLGPVLILATFFGAPYVAQFLPTSGDLKDEVRAELTAEQVTPLEIELAALGTRTTTLEEAVVDTTERFEDRLGVVEDRLDELASAR